MPRVVGKAAASEADTNAPASDMIPAAVHRAKTAGMLETWRLTSEGWTKIDAPMMIPTTIAVACTRPIERRSKNTVYTVGSMGAAEGNPLPVVAARNGGYVISRC